ncbi:MAG: mechanosensitive ion channel family protein [Deltaproteobacteria bacterium]|nr:MAG: mechanosensitive ion channel family protein [Deltaproteobacteria bacterium]
MIRPFKVGDLIEVAGKTGKVAEIGFTTTKLDTPDNVRVLVPNSQVFGQVIQNYSSNDLRRIDLVLGISYDDDIGKAIEVAGRVLDGYDGVVKEPAPTIAVGELADSSVNLVVRPWAKADDYWKVRFELTRRLKEQIEAAGLSIPYPQHDVHLISSDSTAA